MLKAMDDKWDNRDMGRLEEFMAKRCEDCPLCRFARENPRHWFGAFMAWHGKWCPFWKSWEEKYGSRSPK
jgi:hypothetical protein